MEKKIEEELKRIIVKLESRGWRVPCSLPPLQTTRVKGKGDFTSNLPFLIASLNSISVEEAGKIIQEEISLPQDEITEEVDGGYLNFHLSLTSLYRIAQEIMRQGELFPSLNTGKGKKVQVEFVSANPTGPLHVGHGRGASLGSALANLLKKTGYEVESEYYVNNVGKQIELLGESLSLRLREKEGEKIEWDKDHYKGEYLKNMAEKYFTQLKKKMDDTEFLGRFAAERLLEEIKEDLKSFEIEIDSYTFEDSLYKEGKVKEVIEELKNKGALYEKEGAWWLASTHFGDEKDRVVVRKDGRPTYLASDIAYHREKFRKGYKIIVDIWGADHHGYVKRLKSALKFLGLPEENLKVILVQMVSLIKGGRKIPLSTRGGKFLTLRELMEEVGSDVCHFIFLTRRPDTQLEFDIDLAKREAPENPVYYVQYAHARIRSIFRKAEKEENALSPRWDLLKTPEEKEVLRKLAIYSWVLESAAEALEPHRLTGYLQELATCFHKFYDTHRVLGEEESLREARLALCAVTRQVIASTLKILGVKPKERM